MAHITFKLIWYRLGESFDKMAAATENISTWFEWDDHLLDLLLFGWIGWAAVVILVVNSVLTFFGPLQPRMSWDRSKEGVSGATVVIGTGGAESCQWLNSLLNWFYLHYEKFPDFVDVWVKALNEQVVKLGGPVQVKFERVKSGSLPPKFHDVTFEAGPEDKYIVHTKVDSRDLSFAVFASQQTAEGVKLTNLTASILKLKGTLRLKCYREGCDMMVNVAFEGRPDVKVVGKPVNPYQYASEITNSSSDPSDLVDIGVVETVVRNAICLSSSNFNITQMVTGSSLNIVTRSDSQRAQLSPRADLSPRTEAVFEPIEAKDQQSAFHAPPLQSAPRPSRPPPGDKRLLVKVIKASGLGGRDVGTIDPSCIVFMDSPPQSQATSIVKSTVNPFWDEQFLFDVSAKTQELRFEVIDRRRPTGENFLGEAFVYYEDLKRNPSSRQIIPLQGNPNFMGGEMATGSITVELLFLEAWEAEAIRTTNSLSPKRTVEVNQEKTAGGTLVTKTTTTTQRSHSARQDASVDASPNYIEKRSNLFDYDDSYSTPGRVSPNVGLLPQDRSLSSSSDQRYNNSVPRVQNSVPTNTSKIAKQETTKTALRKGESKKAEEPMKVVLVEPSKATPVVDQNLKAIPIPDSGIPYADDDSHVVTASEIPQQEVSIKKESKSRTESAYNGSLPLEPTVREMPNHTYKPVVEEKPVQPVKKAITKEYVQQQNETLEKTKKTDATLSEVEPGAKTKESTVAIQNDLGEDMPAAVNTEETTESSPTEEVRKEQAPVVATHPPSPGRDEQEKKKGSSLARTIKKRFSRSKKRSQSADRSTSLRDESYLRPPEQSYGPSKSKDGDTVASDTDDMDLVRAQQETPNLKKSRSLGGSLKKLFRRGRKRSRSRGDTSRESSHSRSSTRNISQGPSREGSLTRKGGSLPRQSTQQRPPSTGSFSTSSSNPPLRPTPQGPPSAEEQNISRGHWTKTPQSGSPEIHTEIS